MRRSTKRTDGTANKESAVRVIHPETGEDITDRWFELARPRFLALAEALGRLAATQQFEEEQADNAARMDRGDEKIMFWVSEAQLKPLQRLVDMTGSQQKAFDKLIEVADFDPGLARDAG